MSSMILSPDVEEKKSGEKKKLDEGQIRQGWVIEIHHQQLRSKNITWTRC